MVNNTFHAPEGLSLAPNLVPETVRLSRSLPGTSSGNINRITVVPEARTRAETSACPLFLPNQGTESVRFDNPSAIADAMLCLNEV